MGSWSTTAPTNLKTSWTTVVSNEKQGGYRFRSGSSYVYIYFMCRVRASSAWLQDGRLCVKVENYSFQTGDASPGNPLTTNATITNESGTTVSGPAESSTLGDSSETSYGHLRGIWYYTYDASFTPGTVTAGITATRPSSASSSYWASPNCSVTVNVDTKPSFGNDVYINVNNEWKKAVAVWQNVNGTWKKATDVNINVGGTWK